MSIEKETPPESKIIDHKKYYRYRQTPFTSKREADIISKALRKQGKKVRMVTRKIAHGELTGYFLYYR